MFAIVSSGLYEKVSLVLDNFNEKKSVAQSSTAPNEALGRISKPGSARHQRNNNSKKKKDNSMNHIYSRAGI